VEETLKQRALLAQFVVLGLLAYPALTRQKGREQPRQQTGFSMEQEIVPIQKPLSLPERALQALKKDPAVSSCASDEKSPNDGALASWFVASEIDLGRHGEADIIVLPAQLNAPAPMRPAPNACFYGPYTCKFWVLRRTAAGYDIILRVDAHDLEVLSTRRNGYRDIETSISNMRGRATTLYSFDGRKYVKYKETVIPPG
jgi:hypothetical protein